MLYDARGLPDDFVYLDVNDAFGTAHRAGVSGTLELTEPRGRIHRIHMLGGAISAVLTGGWAPTWELGMFDTRIGWGPAGKIAWMFVGGLFIGFGTRLAGGCTSGHGIFGLSNLELPSLVTTLSFMGAGVVTTQLIYHVVLG